MTKIYFLLPFLIINCACTQIYAIDSATRYAFADLEGYPSFAKNLHKQSLTEVYYGPKGWSEFEIGRRLENGIGMKVDIHCATYWHYLASIRSYEVEDTINPGQDANHKPYIVTYYGLPKAKKALNRLKKDGTITDSDINQLLSETIVQRENNTCSIYSKIG